MGGYLSTLKKYAVFSGRATIKEYWLFTLVNFVIVMGLYGLAVAMTGENGQPNSLLTGASVLYMLLTLIPAFAVLARRLHDTDKSAWWMLLLIIPLAGIILLVFSFLKGTDGENRFGPDPRGLITN